MRGDTLVTGGSDGSVRVWSLHSYSPIHRLAAHDNSVTSLQFDEARIVSGGSDGRVKIWDTQTGALIRELSQPAEAVWRVAFESERCVVMASRGRRTIMEVWDFTPPAGDEDISFLAGQDDVEADEDDGAEEDEGSVSPPPIDGEDESHQSYDQEMMDLEPDRNQPNASLHMEDVYRSLSRPRRNSGPTENDDERMAD